MTDSFEQKRKNGLSCRTRSGIQEFKTSGFRLDGRNDKRRSFTLIELLVVLALVAILSVVVVMTLSPAELLKQARDSNRLSDLATINTALNLFSTDVTSGFMGTSTVVYVSLPSTTSNCSNLGLPSLPTGYTYNCVTNQNLRNTDGTGWIPVNFNRISSNSPISQLPIDPTNTTSTRLYYTYIAGGSWELNATVEASKNKLGGSNDLTSKDGGSAVSQYEIGNNLNLNPIEIGDSSLVGYWNFEEGPNATSSDRSGYGNHGTWYGTSTQSEHYPAGKVGNYAGNFNGSSDYVLIGDKENLEMGLNDMTISAWIMTSSSAGGNNVIVGKYSSYPLYYMDSQGGTLVSRVGFDVNNNYSAGAANISNSQWRHVLVSFNRRGYMTRYIDGLISGAPTDISPLQGYNISSGNLFIIGSGITTMYRFKGLIDDVRIYNRALSAAEVLALYNATK